MLTLRYLIPSVPAGVAVDTTAQRSRSGSRTAAPRTETARPNPVATAPARLAEKQGTSTDGRSIVMRARRSAVDRFLRKEEARGSNPRESTSLRREQYRERRTTATSGDLNPTSRAQRAKRASTSGFGSNPRESTPSLTSFVQSFPRVVPFADAHGTPASPLTHSVRSVVLSRRRPFRCTGGLAESTPYPSRPRLSVGAR